MRCRSIQRFCGAHHTPGLGPLGTNLVLVQNYVRDSLVDFKCLGQGLEAATDQGWHSTETTAHQALAPSAPIWLPPKLMFVTDAFIFSASAKAWRQRQIKVGVLLEGPSDKTWFLKCSEKRTFNWDMSNLSDSKHGKKTIQKSTASFSIYIQYDNVWHTAGLGVFDNSTRSEMNDETTAPPKHPNFSL